MPLNIDWQQILLHLLNFVILAGGLYFILYKPVKEFMAKREQHYKEIDDYAMKNRVEAEELRKAAQEKLDAAEEEIAAMHVKASDEIEAEKQRQLGEARAEARRILETAGKTADLRTKKALADANEDIRTLAVEAVRKMLLADGNALDHFLDAAEGGSQDG
jgi:F-type H+-transporting ATPase subunit b